MAAKIPAPYVPGLGYSGSGGGSTQGSGGGNANPPSTMVPAIPSNPTGYSGGIVMADNTLPGALPGNFYNSNGSGGGGAGGGGGAPVYPGLPYSPWTTMPYEVSYGGTGVSSSISGSSVGYAGGGQGGYQQGSPGTQRPNPASPYGGGHAGVYLSTSPSSVSVGGDGTSGTGGGGGGGGYGYGPASPGGPAGGNEYQPGGTGGPGIVWIVYPV